MTTTTPSQTQISSLANKLVDFEASIPFFLRCRAAMVATTSVYSDSAAAVAASPDPTLGGLRLTLQVRRVVFSLTNRQLTLPGGSLSIIHSDTAWPSMPKKQGSFSSDRSLPKPSTTTRSIPARPSLARLTFRLSNVAACVSPVPCPSSFSKTNRAPDRSSSRSSCRSTGCILLFRASTGSSGLV